MSHALRLSLVAAVAATLAACGGGAKLAPGKQNAAAAAFMTSQGAHGAQGNILDLARQNAQLNLDLDVNCSSQGKVTIHYLIDTSNTSTLLRFDLKYDNCSFNGKTWLSGTLNVQMNASFSGGSLTGSLTLNGRVDLSGDIKDFVSATNLTESVDISKLAASAGTNVSVQLDGQLQTSSETHTFSHEGFSITAGHLDADSGNKG